jgi:hypothetical protein
VRTSRSLALALLTQIVFLMTDAAGLAGSVKTDVVAPAVSVREHRDAPCGSGTVIRLDGEVLILTAAHLVDGAAKKGDPVFIAVRQGGDVETRRCRIVSYGWSGGPDSGPDLALLRPDRAAGLAAAEVLRDDDAALDHGETVFYCGDGAGLHRSLERSIVNAPDWEPVDAGVGPYRTYTRVNGLGWYGHSRSGLFVRRRDRWVLAGVVVMLERARDPKSPLLCETPQTVRTFLDRYATGRKARGVTAGR